MSTNTIKVGNLIANKGEKTQGYLEVPGTPVNMPVTIINGANEGKVVAITGGTHGGEYPGIETSIRLAKTLQPKDVSGALIIVHPVNTPAFMAKLQYTGPYDNKNLNREFPGSACGTVTQRIAHTITTEIFAQSDCYMDLHGGDLHEALVPFVIYSKLGDEAQTKTAVEMSKALGVKYVCGSVSTNGTFGHAATMGVPGFLSEIGHLGLWTEGEVTQYITGCENVLRQLGVISGKAQENKDVVMLDFMTGGTAKEDGCWYPCIELEQQVKVGDKMGEIRDYFGNVLGEYYAQYDGVILFIVSSLAITEGDPLYCIGVSE